MPIALLPWFKLSPWPIPVPLVGPLKLQPFGLLAALAIWVGSRNVERRALQLGLSRELTRSFISWTTGLGLIAAYVLNIAMYEPGIAAEIARNPRLLITHWYGLSSFGGFLGGTLTAVIFARVRQVSLIALGDAWCYGIPFAWFFARLGCFVVHDHPGRTSDFLLAVANYNGTGVARHDLGLYEVLWSVPVACFFWWRSRRPSPTGLYLALIPMLYGPVRFALDFLRADSIDGGDIRYGDLTPGQYLSLVLTAVGCVLCLRLGRKCWTATTSSSV